MLEEVSVSENNVIDAHDTFRAVRALDSHDPFPGRLVALCVSGIC